MDDYDMTFVLLQLLYLMLEKVDLYTFKYHFNKLILFQALTGSVDDWNIYDTSGLQSTVSEFNRTIAVIINIRYQ